MPYAVGRAVATALRSRQEHSLSDTMYCVGGHAQYCARSTSSSSANAGTAAAHGHWERLRTTIAKPAGQCVVRLRVPYAVGGHVENVHLITQKHT